MGKFCFVNFYKRILVCSFLHEGGTPQWEGGEVTARYVLQARVLVLAFFSRDAKEFLLMYARVHTCACVCCIVFMQVRLP